MQSHEIRQRFLDFFAKRGHAILPSAPLVPQLDGSDRNLTLFNVAGMQSLMPYLLGQEHPQGKRLVNSQKCIRTVDIDEVGDNTHATFFEMLGNWSLGDYFKEDAIKWSLEFLTNKEEGLGLDINRLYVTVFAGNDVVERDEKSAEIWGVIFRDAGLEPEKRIFYLSSKSNWWTAGPDSPAGPSTEMFYDLTGKLVHGLTHDEFMQADERQDIVEIWNDVFMSYKQEGGIVVGELPNKNVDTGSGLERLTAVVQGKRSIFETDLFIPLLWEIYQGGMQISGVSQDDFYQYLTKKEKVIADHIKSVVFLVAEGVIPSNTDRGYIVRRLIRRAVSYLHQSGNTVSLGMLVGKVLEIYGSTYQELSLQQEKIKEVFAQERKAFEKTLESGMKKFEKIAMTSVAGSVMDKILPAEHVFNLITTDGFPREIIEELAQERGLIIFWEQVEKRLQEHQKLSQSASAGMFKGGLANTNEKTVQLHTAHHLLLSALQQVLGPEVKQRGSNITEERLRMDFVFDRKMTDEEKAQVETIVNEKIQAKLPVVRKEMKREEAEQIGAQMEFGAKYPDTVSVYMIGGEDAHAFSKEFCGGPHVQNTSELGIFKIQKEEASSAGIRRIKAVLQ